MSIFRFFLLIIIYIVFNKVQFFLKKVKNVFNFDSKFASKCQIK